MEESVLPADPHSLSFGRYLKAIRIQRGIPIEAVAVEIKVSLRQLSLIEAEDHDQLPGEVYVKGILRAYARYIGVDEDDIVDRYVINKNMHRDTRASETRLRQSSKMVLPRMLLVLGLLAVVAGLSIYMIHGFKLHYVTAEKKEVAPAVFATAPAPAVSPSSERTGRLLLEIDAVAETWIKVNIDGREHVRYLLHPKDHIELEAASRFNLLVGDAKGLKIRFNGLPIVIPGKSGQTVNIELPPER